MRYITDNTLGQSFVELKCLYCVDGAPSHMHASVCKLMRKRGAPLYISPPNNTMWIQARDKHEINKKMNIDIEELFSPWVIEKSKKLKDKEAIPHLSHAQFGKWVGEAWAAISDDELLNAMRKALFPNGMKLSQLEDTDFPEAHPANAKPDFDSDDDLGSDSDFDCEVLTSEDSSSASDSGEDDGVEIVLAKAARGVWGLGHVFEDKLYFTKDIVDDSFVPKNRKPKPVSPPAPTPAPKPAPKGKHVQLFDMRRRVGKGFYSTAPDAPDSE